MPGRHPRPLLTQRLQVVFPLPGRELSHLKNHLLEGREIPEIKPLRWRCPALCCQPEQREPGEEEVRLLVGHAIVLCP